MMDRSQRQRQNAAPRCDKCGSKMVAQRTQVTHTVYKCSNPACGCRMNKYRDLIR